MEFHNFSVFNPSALWTLLLAELYPRRPRTNYHPYVVGPSHQEKKKNREEIVTYIQTIKRLRRLNPLLNDGGCCFFSKNVGFLSNLIL